jgi:hypothetical protein
MSDAHRSRDQMRKNRHLRVGEEKSRIRRIERRVERLLDAGQVDLGVFDKRMIAMNEDRSGGEKQENGDVSEFGSQLQRKIWDWMSA